MLEHQGALNSLELLSLHISVIHSQFQGLFYHPVKGEVTAQYACGTWPLGLYISA
uniref:Uncharacterized protein n=1 Tax=Anguilla anguilla TaxID=7936 RepID=A0A0E9W6J5_ANGAN